MDGSGYPRWYVAVEAMLLLLAAFIAALALGTVLFGKDMRAAVEEEARATLAAAHDSTSDQLGIPRGGPEFRRCLNLMVQLQATHDRLWEARTAPY